MDLRQKLGTRVSHFKVSRLKVIESDTVRLGTRNFPLAISGNDGPTSYVYERSGDRQAGSKNVLLLTPPLRGLSSNFVRPFGLKAVAVLGFSFWRPLGWRHFHLGGHTTNTFGVNYRVCYRLYQIINTSKFKWRPYLELFWGP